MNWDWDDLRFFLSVCRTNSFVAAAGRLHVTHSTVSRRITALENALNTQLFLRTEKGCRLTPAGEALLPYVEKLETTVMNLDESIHGKDSQLSGTIRIGAPDGLGNCFLAKHLGEFHKQHPHLEVELIAVPMYYSLRQISGDGKGFILAAIINDNDLVDNFLSHYLIVCFPKGFGRIVSRHYNNHFFVLIHI